VGLGETAGRLRARRTSLYTQTVVWVTGLICLAFLLGALAQAWSNNQLAQNMQQEQQHIQQLQQQHTNLQQAANHYQDPYVIESEARLQLGYARPGEHIMVVTNPATQNQPQTYTTNNAFSFQGFWQAWWNIFFGSE
jgi:cell division protein FtsB